MGWGLDESYYFCLLVILTTELMGSSFTIGKLGLAYSSPLLLVAMRFTLAEIIMATIVKILNKPHPVKAIDWVWPIRM